MELVAGEREHVDVLRLDVDLDVADGLYRVRVEDDAVLFAHSADLGDGLDGADLVVGIHDGHERRVLTDGVLDLLGVDQSLRGDGEIGHLEAVLRRCGAPHDARTRW